MKLEIALQKIRDTVRLRHLSLATEDSYCGWVARFSRFVVARCQADWAPAQKMEAFLTQLAHQDVSAATQNQAFCALLFFYREVLGLEVGKVDALRAKRPITLREAPSVEETRALLAAAGDLHGYPTRLIIHLLYGCGMRVTEPCNLRIKDLDFQNSAIIIRAAKGAKDRVVAMPCSLFAGLRDQVEAARVTWKKDCAAHVPVALPGLLAKKYPQSQFAWKWAWVFPSHTVCAHPRTGQTVRWRIHEANVQRAVKAACRQIGADVKPHELRHAYATHAMNRGANPRAIQLAMGHKNLDTTMGYMHAEAMSVRSPLESVYA
jgi:integron integrase